MPQEQRRGRRIAMTPEELDRFLAEERTCRVATVGSGGQPHNTPLWFAWCGGALWLHSLVRSQRWTDIGHNPAVSVVVDAGHDYGELRGVEMTGSLEPVGEIPRRTSPDLLLAEPERLFAEKYLGSAEFVTDGRHGWLRLRPDRVVSWDFRKI